MALISVVRGGRGNLLAGRPRTCVSRITTVRPHFRTVTPQRQATSRTRSTQSRSWSLRFEAANNEHPLLVRGGVGVVLYAISDILAQYIQAHRMMEPFVVDLVRTERVCSWRALVFTPVFYTFYLVLDVAVAPLVGTRMVATKLFVDLVMMGPSITVSFFLWLQMRETGDFEGSMAATKEKLWPALVLGWLYWLPMHTLTYSVVPLRYRLFWVNFGSIWWGAGLSTLNASPNA
eukprot:COSAG02_NODE_3938_length_6013_cov_109.379270_5_plen_233_part_00